MKMTKADQQPQTLTIASYEPSTDRGILTPRFVRKAVSVEELEQQVRSFMSAMEKIVGNLQSQIGKYQMDSITISAEVNAKGQVSLLGNGGEAGAKGGISFTFKIPTGTK